MGWLKESAELNMVVMSVTAPTFQLPMGWSKAVAEPNIPLILVVAPTFQFPIGWLKAVAPENRNDMSVTLEVSQLPMGWLKAAASINIPFIVVTLEVSQQLKFSLNVAAFPFPKSFALKALAMVVTAETSQQLMTLPNSSYPSRFPSRNSVTASLKVASVRAFPLAPAALHVLVQNTWRHDTHQVFPCVPRRVRSGSVASAQPEPSKMLPTLVRDAVA